MKNSMIITIIVVLMVGGAAFFGGMKYQETKASSNFRGQFQGNRQGSGNGQGRLGNMAGAVVGEIISQDDKSITVKLDDGSSKIVLLSNNVTVSKTDTGSKSDLKIGGKVGVFGTTNSDGTVTAQNIQLNPTARGMFGQHSQ